MEQRDLEKLWVLQVVKKLATFNGTRSFITVFTKACQIQSQMHLAHIFSPYFHQIHSIIISHLCLGLPKGLFPTTFRLKFNMHFSYFPCMLHARPTSSSLIWLPWCLVKRIIDSRHVMKDVWEGNFRLQERKYTSWYFLRWLDLILFKHSRLLYSSILSLYSLQHVNNIGRQLRQKK
jgi:hypothetical protein